MDVQEAVSESTPAGAAEESKRDGLRRFTMGPNDVLEGKLTYEGHVHVDGRAEGEFRVTGNIEVASGAKVKAFLEASNVTVKGEVEGALKARDKLILGKNARLSGDVTVRRLQIEDGASLNGHVRMGDVEQPGSGG
ncbi:MAG TPA: polymer-forming cytoskeletal protein [Candidatus Dormibacteraeota bacterium]|nr:polymer-forming cytoskeletal protein [Candidatus Dormibacteraeota bacterium]